MEFVERKTSQGYGTEKAEYIFDLTFGDGLMIHRYENQVSLETTDHLGRMRQTQNVGVVRSGNARVRLVIEVSNCEVQSEANE